jgi:type IV secretory pathway TrbF-like protein
MKSADKPNGITLSHNGRSEQANPYLDARRHWNSQIDQAFSAVNVWKLMAVLGLLVGLTGVIGIMYIGSKSKYVPFIVEVDKLGEAVTVGPARLASSASAMVIRSFLASFISSARLVTPDTNVQRQAIFRVYGMLRRNDPSTNRMNEYLSDEAETSPFKRSKNFMVSTDHYTVLPISDTSWQVDWEETSRDRDGNVIGKPANMRATLQVYLDPPGSGAQQSDVQKNPIGLWVKDFNWMQK